MNLPSFLLGLATGMILVALLVLGAVGFDVAGAALRRCVRRGPR